MRFYKYLVTNLEGCNGAEGGTGMQVSDTPCISSSSLPPSEPADAESQIPRPTEPRYKYHFNNNIT